jgi:hypothetical protein
MRQLFIIASFITLSAVKAPAIADKLMCRNNQLNKSRLGPRKVLHLAMAGVGPKGSFGFSSILAACKHESSSV